MGSRRSESVLGYPVRNGSKDPLAALERDETGRRGKSRRALYTQRRLKADTEYWKEIRGVYRGEDWVQGKSRKHSLVYGLCNEAKINY